MYGDCQDITEREILIEYADFAIDLLGHEDNSDSSLQLVSELAELGREKDNKCSGLLQTDQSKLKCVCLSKSSNRENSNIDEVKPILITLQ